MTLVDGIGCWMSPPPVNCDTPRSALFLDRDGVVMVERGFPSKAADVELHPGAATVIAAANAGGIATVIVTNQSGIGRGLFGWSAFEEVQDELICQLADHGARIDLTLACGYHPAATGPLSVDEHSWRKPNAGMLDAAARVLRLDVTRSWIIGDRATDIAAGRAAGLAGGTHVMTGHADSEQRQRAESLMTSQFRVEFAPSIADTIHIVQRIKRTTHAR